MSKPTSTTVPSSYYPVPSSSSTTNHTTRSPGPRPLHLLDGTITSSSSASALSPSPSTSARASRRQSSISYYSPDRTPDYYTSSSINLNNAARSPSSARGTQSVHVGAGLSRSSLVGRGSPALKGRHWEIQRTSLLLEKEREKEKERPPLTHAELLLFIAQRESKCLEFRLQLAMHEEGLLQLKHKWERISQPPPDAVSRTPSNAITNPASAVVAGLTGPAVLEGIKEGMHRFLAAGLPITDPNLTPSSPSPLSASPLVISWQRSSPLSVERSSPLTGGPTTQRWRTHTRETESLSSVSTQATATSATTWYSQCSSSTAASSVGRELVGEDVGEHQKPLGESDNFRAAPEVMEHDTVATPSKSPDHAFKRKDRQQGAVEPQQPVPGEPQPQGEPDEEEFDEATFTSSLDLTLSGGAKVRRRNSKDVVPLRWNSGLSAIEPGLTANTTTASSVESSRAPPPPPEPEGTAKVEGSSGAREGTNGNMRATINTNGHGYAAQTNGGVGRGMNGVGSLPPPSSIPGPGVLTGGGASWVGSVGKKLGELRDNPTLTKSQKRASVLLSDVSQSIVSAWNAPTTPIGSAPPISRRLSTPLHTSPLSPSLFDNDNDDTIRMVSVMAPDFKKRHPTPLMLSQPDGRTKPSNKRQRHSPMPRLKMKTRNGI
ncbi:hypothetical protein K443DRAFT_675536, partial [Laccaria amethystina LaAM-08-1]